MKEKPVAPRNKFMPVGKSKLITGTITSPELSNLCLIMVPCSESGKAESEVYDLLDKKWKNVKADFRGWFANHLDFKIGSIHSLPVQSDTWCVSVLCYDKEGNLNEKGLVDCMKKLGKLAKSEKASVHISTMTLAALPQLEELVPMYLLDNGIHTFFYEEAEKQV